MYLYIKLNLGDTRVCRAFAATSALPREGRPGGAAYGVALMVMY
jgi:hypothetical protein